MSCKISKYRCPFYCFPARQILRALCCTGSLYLPGAGRNIVLSSTIFMYLGTKQEEQRFLDLIVAGFSWSSYAPNFFIHVQYWTTEDSGTHWKGHREDQEGISWENVWRDHRISKSAHCGLIIMKTKDLGWKENYRIQNIDTEDSQENIMVERGQVIRIWHKYMTEIYGRSNRRENLRGAADK